MKLDLVHSRRAACFWVLGMLLSGGWLAWRFSPVSALAQPGSSLPAGTCGTSYAANLTTSGGMPPYAWSVTGGQLPPGLTMDSSGSISGTPSSSGTFGFNVLVEDSANPPWTATSTFTIPVAKPTSTTLWSADFETGTISQWYAPATSPNGKEGGGEFNSGISMSQVSQSHAHSGAWGLEMMVAPPPRSAARMFRWLEPRTYNKLFYSTWYYFPQRYSVTNYWNVFQWKSKNSATGQDDPFFVLNVGNRPSGAMYLYLYNWQRQQTYTQWVKDIPIGQWFNVEGYYACASDGTGHVTFWQDGILLFDISNTQTRYVTGDCQWSIDNYSDSLAPTPATIYIDDASISLTSKWLFTECVDSEIRRTRPRL